MFRLYIVFANIVEDSIRPYIGSNIRISKLGTTNEAIIVIKTAVISYRQELKEYITNGFLDIRALTEGR